MSKENKEGVVELDDDELQEEKLSIDKKIEELTAKKQEIVSEQGKRAIGDKQASLADCVNGFKKAGKSRLKEEKELSDKLQSALNSTKKRKKSAA